MSTIFNQTTQSFNSNNTTLKDVMMSGDLGVSGDLFVAGELGVSGTVIFDGDLEVNGGAITSTAPTFELLSTSDGIAAATLPTTINIGSVTAGPLVTTNIQSQVNNIGQAATGQVATTAARASMAFLVAGAGVGTGSQLFMDASGANLVGAISSDGGTNFRPLALSSYTGLGFNAVVLENATATLTVDSVNQSDYAGGGGASTANLPAATAGAVIVYFQSVPYTGVNAITFNCAGNDVFATGSLAPNPAAVAWDISSAGETALEFTPAAATSNLFDAGSAIVFQCANVAAGAIGTWFVDIRAVPGTTATAGAFAWAA